MALAQDFQFLTDIDDRYDTEMMQNGIFTWSEMGNRETSYQFNAFIAYRMSQIFQSFTNLTEWHSWILQTAVPKLRLINNIPLPHHVKM